MPEVPTFLYDSYVEAGEILVNSGVTHETRGSTFFKETGLRLVGVGSEKLVVEHPTNPDMVFAGYVYNNYEKVNYTRTHFYLQKVLAILFPNNFPLIHAAFYSRNAGFAVGSVLERIYQDAGVNNTNDRKFATIFENTVAMPAYDAGIIFYYDSAWYNFIIRESVPVYVDTLVLRDFIDVEKLRAYAENRGLLELDRCRLIKLAKRYNHLFEMYKRNPKR